MYKKYDLADIQKVVVGLLQDNNPMSSTEISKKIGTNRITLSKYLDILYFQKIINKKKIGSVNFWFLNPGITNYIIKDDDYTELQQKLLISLINNEEEITESTILSLINGKINLKKIITDVFFPVLKTIFELHNRGKIGKTEKLHLITNITESIKLLSYSIGNNNNIKRRNSVIIIVSGDDDSMPICNMINIFAKKNKLNSILIGNVESYIDPFYDIDFQRFVKKVINKSKTKIYICICSFNDTSIKFLSLALNDTEITEKINLIVFSNENTKGKIQNKYKENIITDFARLMEIIEKEV
jgi:predicted transcriptional regulator